MKSIILFLVIILYCAGVSGQQVVSTAGGTLGNVNGSMSYTIGEGVAQTLTGGGIALTQGFQQAYITVSEIVEIKDLGFSISAFPNPTTDVVKLGIGKEDLSGLQYLLFDFSGKLMNQKVIESNETSVPFRHLSAGPYILKVLDGKQELKTFKIIKY